jgi:F-type H+-transporting ATPase subunit b
MRLRTLARRAVPFALTLAALLLAVGPALADEGHASDQKTGGLSFLDLERYDLGIYTLVVFGLLCLILYKLAWPKISEGLERREKMVREARDEAVRTKREAEELRARLQAEFAQAHDQIRAMLDEARRDAEVLKAREKEAGQREAAAERERAKREIEATKDAIVQELNRHAVQLAALMASKAVRRQLTLEDQGRLVEESLAELKAGAGRG